MRIAATLPLTMYLRPSRFNGRTTRRERSASGMQKKACHFSRDLNFRPIGVLRSEPGRFQFAGGPVKLFCQCQTPSCRHPTERLELLWAGLFIRQHGNTMGPLL